MAAARLLFFLGLSCLSPPSALAVRVVNQALETGEAELDEEAEILPPCPRLAIPATDLAEDAKSWCDPMLVPEEERAPEKLQGLFWLKDLPLPDVAACFSLGRWDKVSLTLTLEVWSSFVFKDQESSLALAGTLFQAGMSYKVKFDGPELTKANINPVGGSRLGKLPVLFFGSISDFVLEEIPSLAPGDMWERPSYFGVGPLKVKTNSYTAVRVLSGKLEPTVMAEDMVATFEDQGVKTLMRFPKTCEPDAAEQGLGNARPGTASCGAGIILALAGQPQLGVRHLPGPADGEETPLAQYVGPQGCEVKFLQLCKRGFVAVEARLSEKCTRRDSLFAVPSARSSFLKGSWEVCAPKSGRLSLLQPVLSSLFDTVIPAGVEVAGCVRALPAADWPELDAMRGELPAQLPALVSRKRQAGGCPLFRSDTDRMARARDFPGLTYWLKGFRKSQANRALSWKGGDQASLVPQAVQETLGNLFSLAFFAAATKGNRTTAFEISSELNCGEPSPFIGGPAVWRHHDVAAYSSDPKQRRVASTATVPSAEACFDPTMPLFLSSGSAEHTQMRRLIDEAGFDKLAETELPAIEGHAPSKGRGDQAPTEMEVARLVLPRVMEAIWGKRPSASDVDAIVTYLKSGKLCIFGETAKKLKLLSSDAMDKIKGIRYRNRDFGRQGPTAEKMGQLLEEERYADLKKLMLTRTPEAPLETLLLNVGDSVLFAGLLGTSDMATKCAAFQWADPKHVSLYRKDKAAYLHELMRYDGAVTSFTTATNGKESWKLEGQEMTLAEGTPIQAVLASANRDASVFPEPERFDPSRREQGEQLAWNGRLKDVMARNYTGAPRFCPGYALSIKIATQVCDHYTQHLSGWGKDSQDAGISGQVVVLQPGKFMGKEGLVSHYDFKRKQYCVVDATSEPSFDVGCFKPDELRVLGPGRGWARTLEDEARKCPAITQAAVTFLIDYGARGYSGDTWMTKALDKLVGKNPGTGRLDGDWADEFTLGFYALVLHLDLRRYKWRHADGVTRPFRTGLAEQFSVGRISSPNIDIDQTSLLEKLPDGLPLGKILPSVDCLQNTLRAMDFSDDIGELQSFNTWQHVLSKSSKKTKKEWVLSFYEGYLNGDKDGVWPVVEVDYRQRFHSAAEDAWDDALERTMAFETIGVHRVQTSDRSYGGESLPFVVKLNTFAAIEMRDNWGKLCTDMYFTEAGMPALIVLPDGAEVARGSKDWQYWKFVWRSSLVTAVTLVDHLHATHFRTANLLAKTSRQALSPDHPYRRLTSIFTFGTIDVNVAAMHALAGPRHSLHRTTGVRDFEALSEMVPKMVHSPDAAHEAFHKEEAWQALPAKLRESPYFADGRLVFQALYKMIKGMFDFYRSDFCDEHGLIKDPDVNLMHQVLDEEYKKSGYVPQQPKTCESLPFQTASTVFQVTAYHRHVGAVADFYVDPELVSFSWKEGERSGRPRQVMIASGVAAFTGTRQPKLTEDFTHVFKGIRHEDKVLEVWAKFQQELQEIKKVVAARNEKRNVPNLHADPDFIECSVAV